MKLYELPEAYAAIMEQIADGELTPELEAELDLLDATLQGKVDGVCKMIATLQREAEAIDAEAQRLKQRAISRDNAAKRLKDYLMRTFEAIGCQKVKTTMFTCSVAKNSRPSIKWPDFLAIPEEFRRTIVELDGTKAYEWWKDHASLPEGFIVTEGKHLRIS